MSTPTDSPWDHEVDILVAGTGAAAFAAALAAEDAGATTLMVEAAPVWGGTTSWSGGGVWAPANSLELKAGFDDSPDKALQYMEQVIAPVGPASSPERKRTYVDTVPEVIDFLADKGVVWMLSKDYPDYYPDKPGGMAGGRSLETKPFNIKKLGDAWQTANAKEGGIPLGVMTDDVWLLSRAWSTFSGFRRGVRLVLRLLGAAVTGKSLRGMGGALISHLFLAAQKRGIPYWLDAPLTELIVEGDEVVGAVVERQGVATRIRARRGVVLGAGGFAHRTEWREQFQKVPGWSSAPPADRGTAIEAAIRIGAETAMMDDAWWGSSFVTPEGKGGFFLWERSYPHGIIVNQRGVRFVNESASYIDVGHAMLADSDAAGAPSLGTASPAVPSWLIGDRRLTRRYLFQPTLMSDKKKLIEAGSFVEADTLDELAAAIGVPVDALRATVDRFNGFADTGKDLDFHRGDTAYDRYYSDPTRKPNPNLGRIEKGPFIALKVVPGDLGTKGGLLTDEHARVLRADGSAIAGLYAAGNTTASVMGGTYPGAGATLGPALTFGYLGARHAAARRL